MAHVNRQITLAARPDGLPKLSDFNLDYSLLPNPAPGEALVRSVYLALDPHLRGLRGATGSYGRPVALGEILSGRAVGLVVESQDSAFRVGDAVEGRLGWQEYAAVPGHELRKLEPSLAPISTALGVLGIPGLTAYFGLLSLCAPRRGETVLVSGAAGAVGMLAGQIAKIKGCRVVGVAGSDAKISWLLEDLGFDGAFNYKTEEDFSAKLGELCPEGIDVYFDNVGGAMTDAVLRRINTRARIAVCGQISQYGLEKPGVGPRWLHQLIVKQAKVQGFLVSSYARRFPEALQRLSRWRKQGKLKFREDVAQGIEAAPQAFIGMLQGKNQGKQLVQLSEA